MDHPRVIRLAACLAVIALTIAGCGAIGPPAGPTAVATSGTPFVRWPAPSDPLERTTAAGLVAETTEHLAFHVHAHLDVFIDGTPVVVPAGIGINITDPGVKAFPLPGGSNAYGGITGCDQPCISPLHTHGPTGIIHTESATTTPNTLGQFFTEWGVPLSAACVGEYCAPQQPIAVYLGGAPFTGDPAMIQLSDRLVIAIVIGKPPAVIPAIADFTQD